MPRPAKKKKPARAAAPSPDALRYKILAVDDEPDSLVVLKQRLENDGFSVVLAKNADEAFQAAVDSKPDVVLSDVAMPGADGFALCRRLKSDARTSSTPVILLSGLHSSEDDQLEGLEGGADDYLPKPYPPRLLSAKIRTLLRRYAAPHELGETLAAESIKLDVQARTVEHKGKRIALTRKEFDLLTLFLRKPGRALGVDYLLETVWGYDPADYNDPRTLQVHVSSLRKKLGPKLGKRIISVTGHGYRFDAA